jgi:hypothetical protein
MGLVHGGYADSFCWNATISLQAKGYTTISGSNPLGGTPTAAGKRNVTALVYIAAFVPDVGQTHGERSGAVYEGGWNDGRRPVSEQGGSGGVRGRHPRIRIAAAAGHAAAVA